MLRTDMQVYVYSRAYAGGLTWTHVSREDHRVLHEAAAAAILTNLDTKLENAGVDPRIPWLGNRRLRFTFH